LEINLNKRSNKQFPLFCCYAATQLALPLHQERTQEVCNCKEGQQRLTGSNGTPAMKLGHMNIVLKWCMCMLVVVLGFCDHNYNYHYYYYYYVLVCLVVIFPFFFLSVFCFILLSYFVCIFF